MKAKALIAFACLTFVWAGLTAVEYDSAVRFWILLDLFVSVFALVVVLNALCRALKGTKTTMAFILVC